MRSSGGPTEIRKRKRQGPHEDLHDNGLDFPPFKDLSASSYGQESEEISLHSIANLQRGIQPVYLPGEKKDPELEILLQSYLALAHRRPSPSRRRQAKGGSAGSACAEPTWVRSTYASLPFPLIRQDGTLVRDNAGADAVPSVCSEEITYYTAAICPMKAPVVAY